MKVLSIKQPYAELVVSGRKKIELRKWNTKYRGEFLIHASKIPDKRAMKKFVFRNLPLGAIIGKAKLVDIKKYKNNKELKADKDMHLVSENFGYYGFTLNNTKRINPIPCKGQLGFWNFARKI